MHQLSWTASLVVNCISHQVFSVRAFLKLVVVHKCYSCLSTCLPVVSPYVHCHLYAAFFSNIQLGEYLRRAVFFVQSGSFHDIRCNKDPVSFGTEVIMQFLNVIIRANYQDSFFPHHGHHISLPLCSFLALRKIPSWNILRSRPLSLQARSMFADVCPTSSTSTPSTFIKSLSICTLQFPATFVFLTPFSPRKFLTSIALSFSVMVMGKCVYMTFSS